jgi:hypothetical protein
MTIAAVSGLTAKMNNVGNARANGFRSSERTTTLILFFVPLRALRAFVVIFFPFSPAQNSIICGSGRATSASCPRLRSSLANSAYP